MSTINSFPECRQFCWTIDSLPTNSCASAACAALNDAGTSNSRRLRTSAAQRISQSSRGNLSTYLNERYLNERRQRKFRCPANSGYSRCQREAADRIGARSSIAKCLDAAARLALLVAVWRPIGQRPKVIPSTDSDRLVEHVDGSVDASMLHSHKLT